MKYLLFNSILLLTSVASFAQLTVKPNGSTDSYVYVKDQVLFVTDYVNLSENPTADTKASIYLRNESQLLQGSPSSPTTNSGDGYISVFQDSNSDSYDYNYWGSPVGNPNGSVPGNQNFGILKVYDPDPIILTKSTVTAVTPAHNGTSSPLTISSRWLYRFPAGGPWSAIGSGDNVPSGYGFTMKGVGETPAGVPETMNQTYDFRGRPNSGDISVGIKANVETLAGNPYPSAIDMIKFYWDPDNTEIQEIRYWDEDRTINSHYYVDNKGGYGSWVPASADDNVPDSWTGTYTVANFYNYDSAGNQGSDTGDNGEMVDRRFAPIGQGFMLIGESSVSGPQTVIFKNEHRRYIKEGNNSDFLRPGRNNGNFSPDIKIDPNIETDTGNNNNDDNGDDEGGNDEDSTVPEMSYIRIYTTFHDFNGEPTHFRDMILSFSDEATDGYDRGFDAYHPEDGAVSDAFFPIWDDSFVPENSSKNLVIQGTNFEVEKSVPINLVVGGSGFVQIQVVEEVNFYYPAYIYDNEQNWYKKITGGELLGFRLNPGNYENRFFIVFQAHGTNVFKGANIKEFKSLEAEVTSAVDFFQNNYMQQLEVMNPKGYTIESANIFDMSGKLVISKSHLGNDTSYNFDTRSLSDGIYLVKLITNENIGINYKMKVYNKR